MVTSCWTGNQYAGVLASILAIGSSTVFYNAYHINFLYMTHVVPWMLYAITMYFRKFKFRYLVIFALAYNSALYSYQIVMGASYIIMLSVAAIILYHKQLQLNVVELKNIPVWHVFTLGVVVVIMTYPAILVFLEFRDKLLAISRLNDITVTDNYTLTWQNVFHRMSGSICYVKFWVTLFGGIFSDSWEELRQYVGPVALPCVVVALVSLRRVCLVCSHEWASCINVGGEYLSC